VKPSKSKAEPRKVVYTLRGGPGELFSSTEHEVICAGPADSSKTFAGCLKAHDICSNFPGAQGAMVRKTYASLAGSAVKTFQRITKGSGVEDFGGETPSAFIYPNGSKIWLGGMDNSNRVLSSERDFIFVPQAEELTESEWEILSTRCTGRGAVVKNAQLYGDCNPAGSKHWIRTRKSLRLLRATHKDNPDLYDDAGNITDEGRKRIGLLEESLTGVRRKRLLEGIWATAEGAVYEMFDVAVHVKVRERSEMQRFYFALDDGFTNPAVILDIGSDSDGRWHVFREFYKRGWVQDDVAGVAADWHKERRVDLAAVDEAAAGLVEALKRKGLPARGGKGRITDGIATIQARLKVQADGKPRLTVDPSCVETINEFESYVWKPEKDVPVDDDNHSMGALRYLADVLSGATGGQVSVQSSAYGGSLGGVNRRETLT
jgi:phage terminase large subunit